MARLSYKPGDFDLVVRRSKTGLGLFAESEIPKGSCIIEYFGPQLTAEEEEKSRSKYLFEVHSRKTIDGALRKNTARYINHSCRPNCEPNIHKGRVYIHSLRRIRPGEELNYDYGTNYFNEFLKGICACEKCKPTAAKRRPVAKKVAAKRATKTKKKPKRKAA
jgi:SET domain-containing protein